MQYIKYLHCQVYVPFLALCCPRAFQARGDAASTMQGRATNAHVSQGRAPQGWRQEEQTGEEAEQGQWHTILRDRKSPQPFQHKLCAPLSKSELFAMGSVQFSYPAESPKICLLNRVLGKLLSIFPRKKKQNTESLNFLQSGPPKFSKSDFSGLAPIR